MVDCLIGESRCFEMIYPGVTRELFMSMQFASKPTSSSKQSGYALERIMKVHAPVIP